MAGYLSGGVAQPLSKAGYLSKIPDETFRPGAESHMWQSLVGVTLITVVLLLVIWAVGRATLGE